MRPIALLLCTLALAACTLAGPTSAAVCVVGTVEVTQPNDPGFEGLYKYCVTATWAVEQFGLSHIDFFLELENCECACEEGVILFPTPAGSSDGEPAPCVVEYDGEYLCMGDPTVPEDMNGPAVKYNALEGDDGCEPGIAGTGTWCFYSPFPPAPPSTHTSAIKHGQEVCYGVVTGSLPMCDCSTPTHHSTFGRLKVHYR